MGNYSGLVVDGANQNDRAGENVSAAGDVNGDGIADFIVSGRNIDTDGPDGAAYVVFGQAGDGFPTDISLSDLDGTNGFRVSQESYVNNNGYTYGFGAVAASVGDINNDGIDDIIVAGNGSSAYSEGSASGYVIYGRDTSEDGDFDADVNVDTLDPADGFKVSGNGPVIQAAEVGDFNGDGVDDVLLNVGSDYGYYNPEAGYSYTQTAGYVIFGASDIAEDGIVDLEGLDGSDGFEIEGVSGGGGGFYGGYYGGPGYVGGGVVTNLGDLNGDGIDDIGLGTVDRYFGSEELEDEQGNAYTNYFVAVSRNAYILFGEETNADRKDAADGQYVNWGDLNSYDRYDYGPYGGEYGFGGPLTYSSTQVSAIGDVNGDGFDDVLISQSNNFLSGDLNPVAATGDDARGVAGIIFGGPDGVDTDDDGPLDGVNSNVFLGATFGTGALAFTPDIMIVNSDPESVGFGAEISGAGDVNGDGLADFLIASQANFGSPVNSVFLVFGQDVEGDNALPAFLDLDNLEQSELDDIAYKFTFETQNNNVFGTNVSLTATGDVNGDGFDDFILSQPFFDVSGEAGGGEVYTPGDATGRTYVIFGGTDALEAADNADGSNDNAISVANLGVDVVTGELPITVSVANQGFLLRQFEGDTGSTVFAFTVQRTGNLQQSVSVDYSVAGSGFDPAEANDFVGGAFPSGSVDFAIGSATAVVEIEVQGDDLIEGNESFTFSIDNPTTSSTSGVNLGISESFAQILNDDVPASLRVLSTNAAESGALTFTILRSGDLNSTVDVDFVLSGTGFSTVDANDIADVLVNGTSLGGGLGQSGTVSFEVGESTKVITVIPVDDDVIENNERIELTISNPTSSGPVVISDNNDTAFVLNNDFPPQILVEGGGSFLEGSSVEGVTPVTFTIVRRGETDGVTEVTYSLNPLPFQGDFFAADGNDIDSFLPAPGNVVRFEDGETEKEVIVNINHDGIIEPREQFELRIDSVQSFNGETYDVVVAARTATILNDDGRPPVTPPGVEADVFGDPHIITLDGLGYDFQAVGEYILVESTIANDPRDFQVQVRFEPLPGSDLVSVTTRLSVDVAGSTIEIDALGPDALLIDGQPVSLEQLATGALDVDGNDFYDVFYNEDLSEFFIVLNDLNEQLMVKNMDGVLNICVFLSDEEGGHAGNVRGLMGNANGDSTDDLMLRDGSVTFGTDPTFEELYVTYANSWKVGDERNFTDAEGTGEFPASFPVAKISIDDLPAAVLAAAEAAVDAAGITDPIIRESAILDFALTGDADFIQGALGLAAEATDELDVTDAPDLPLTIGVTPAETSLAEGDSGTGEVLYTFFRLGTDTRAVTVDYAIAGDVDAADLAEGTELTGQITIPDGAGSVTLSLGLLGDTTTEGDEDIVVSITGNDAGALVASASGTTTVLTDDFAPVAEDDAFSTDEDTGISGSLFDANPDLQDTDADGDTLTVTSVTMDNGQTRAANGGLIILPSGAHLRVNDDGTFTYNPEGFTIAASGARDTVFDRLGEGEIATDTFSYTISDGNGGTDTATVEINVTGINDRPYASIAQQNPTEDETASGNVLTDPSGGGADFDPEGGDLTVTQINGQLLADIDEDADTDGAQITVGDGGVLTIFGNGDFEFDTNGAYEYLGDGAGQLVARLQSVSYTIADEQGLEDSDQLRFFVQGVNDDPDAMDDSAETEFETTVNIDVLTNDTDVDNDAEDLIVIEATSDDGQATIMDDGTLNFTPNDGFSGDAEISYTVSDGSGGSSTATVTVTVEEPANLAPQAVDDEYTVDEDVPDYLFFTDNDTDPEDDFLEVSIVDGPDNGTIEFDGEGYIYVSDENYNGDDSFTYTVSDGVNTSEVATVSITVAPVNDAPDAVAITATAGEDDDPIQVNLLAGAIDVDGDDLSTANVSIESLEGRLLGVSDFDLGNDFLTLTPGQFEDLGVGEVAEIRVTYDVTDGELSVQNTALLTIQGANDGPVANDDTGQGDQGTSITINALANDTDVDSNDVLSLLSADDGANGSVEIVDGELVYTANEGFFGTDQFTYQMSDGTTTAEASVFITVNEVEVPNTPPVANDFAVMVNEDGSVSVDFEGNSSDADGDSLDLSIGDASNGTIAFDGEEFRYTPGADFNGEDSFTYTVNDGNGGEATGTVSVTVNAVNDGPVLAAAGPFDVDENTTAVGTIAASDIDSDALMFDIIGGADGGLFSIDEDTGALSFTAAPDFEAPGDDDGDNTYEVEVSVSDGEESASQLVTVNVQDVDDTGPVLNTITGTEGRDVLIGTAGDDYFIFNGGRGDVGVGRGGSDTFDLAANLGNGGRDYTRISDWGDDDTLVGIDITDVNLATVRSTDSYLRFSYGPDNDTLLVTGDVEDGLGALFDLGVA